jgi:hypothetical protein
MGLGERALTGEDYSPLSDPVDESVTLKADQLRRVARELLEVADNLDPRPTTTKRSKPYPRGTYSDHYLADVVRGIYRSRRNRAKHLPDELFGEPAWDMLLDLFVNKVSGRRISVTSICQAAGVPPTTALRWLDILQRQGLAERFPSLLDRRTSEIRLSKSGYAAVRKWLVSYLDSRG